MTAYTYELFAQDLLADPEKAFNALNGLSSDVAFAFGKRALLNAREHPHALLPLLKRVPLDTDAVHMITHLLCTQPDVTTLGVFMDYLKQHHQHKTSFASMIDVFQGVLKNQPTVLKRGAIKQGGARHEDDLIKCAIVLGRMQMLLDAQPQPKNYFFTEHALRWACQHHYPEDVKILAPYAQTIVLEKTLVDMVKDANIPMVEILQQSSPFQPHMLRQMLSLAVMHNQPIMVQWVMNHPTPPQVSFDTVVWACRHHSQPCVELLLPHVDPDDLMPKMKEYSQPFWKFLKPIVNMYLDQQAMLEVVQLDNKPVKRKKKI